MRYALLIYVDPAAYAGMSEAQQGAIFQEYFAVTDEMQKRGVDTGSGAPLQPINTATTVRVRNSKMLTTDGPFAETKEHLVGFYILNCKNLDEALEFAAKIPDARLGSVEVRPVQEIQYPPS
ncbi:MAG TPA: YciI family protein [Anaerolineae bacterium]|nr:YciI family protein [Anaerolineae bacterium]